MELVIIVAVVAAAVWYFFFKNKEEVKEALEFMPQKVEDESKTEEVKIETPVQAVEPATVEVAKKTPKTKRATKPKTEGVPAAKISKPKTKKPSMTVVK
jgi:flagellar basal body-associated protein FliL